MAKKEKESKTENTETNKVESKVVQPKTENKVENTAEPKKSGAPVVADKPSAEKKRKIPKLLLMVGLVFIGIVIGGGAILMLSFSSGDSFHERGEDYENDYNYDALEAPPWIEDEEHLEVFSDLREKLESAGEGIDGDFYEEVAEGDLSDLYDELESELEDTTDDYEDDIFATLDLDWDNVIYDEDYHFLFQVNDIDRFTFTEHAYESNSGEIYPVIVYCYRLIETQVTPIELCSDEDSVVIFALSILTEDQYLENLDIYGATGILLAEDLDIHFLLDFPNGEIADEVPIDEIYNMIETTFMLEP